jgi:hypothetical protein
MLEIEQALRSERASACSPARDHAATRVATASSSSAPDRGSGVARHRHRVTGGDSFCTAFEERSIGLPARHVRPAKPARAHPRPGHHRRLRMPERPLLRHGTMLRRRPRLARLGPVLDRHRPGGRHRLPGQRSADRAGPARHADQRARRPDPARHGRHRLCLGHPARRPPPTPAAASRQNSNASRVVPSAPVLGTSQQPSTMATLAGDRP